MWLRNESAMIKNHKKRYQRSKQEPTRTQAFVISNRTRTKRRKTRSQHCSRVKTLAYRFRWALATRLNASPLISATQTRKSWYGSSWPGRAGEALNNVRVLVREEFMPQDIYLFTGKRRLALMELCDQVPVLRFKVAHYSFSETQ